MGPFVRPNKDFLFLFFSAACVLPAQAENRSNVDDSQPTNPPEKMLVVGIKSGDGLKSWQTQRRVRVIAGRNLEQDQDPAADGWLSKGGEGEISSLSVHYCDPGSSKVL